MDLATEAAAVLGDVWLPSKADPILSLWQEEVSGRS